MQEKDQGQRHPTTPYNALYPRTHDSEPTPPNSQAVCVTKHTEPKQLIRPQTTSTIRTPIPRHQQRSRQSGIYNEITKLNKQLIDIATRIIHRLKQISLKLILHEVLNITYQNQHIITIEISYIHNQLAHNNKIHIPISDLPKMIASHNNRKQPFYNNSDS